MIKIKRPVLKKAQKVVASKRLEVTAELILDLLKQRHKDRQWVFFPEMVFSTQAKTDNEQADSRVDAWAMNLWPSRKFERISYEIKISRHDLLRELRSPEKRIPGLKISNSFYYILPHGCCDVSDIPDECGLIVVTKPKHGQYYILKMAKKAPWREPEELGLDFWASFARRVGDQTGEYVNDYNRREAQKAANEAKNAGRRKKKISEGASSTKRRPPVL